MVREIPHSGVWTFFRLIWAEVMRGQTPNANGVPSRRPRLAPRAYLGSLARVRQPQRGCAQGFSPNHRMVRRPFPWPRSWDASITFLSFSVSQSNLEPVRQYISHPEEHHRKSDFQTERRALLRRHPREWDERYVLDQAATPLGLMASTSPIPKVGAARQPWAG